MTLRASYAPNQTNVDFFARNASGQWWRTSGTPAFENFDAENLAEYRIPANEVPAGSGLYFGEEPVEATEFELRVRGATIAASYVVAGPAETSPVESSDPVLVNDGGVYKLKTYKRGTSVEVLPAKTAKQPDGSNLTDPTTQRLAGYRE